MSKFLIAAATASALFVLGSAPAAAWDGPEGGIDARQQRQHDRIVEGVRSGELTRHEARWLMREQRAIERKKMAYLADGELSRREAYDLHEDLNRAKEHIYNQRHDVDYRPSPEYSRDEWGRGDR
jgi:hypothetical protein